MLAITLLTGLLLTAIITDLRSRTIPNIIIAMGIISGLSLSGMGLIDNTNLIDSFAGAVTGLVLFLPVYLLNKMGAGDVKLLAMCGTFIGAEATLIASLCALLVGGILALLWKGLIAQFPIKDKRYPFAAAIAAGAGLAPFVHFA